ncbi:MAG: hypothetical protein ACREF7_01450 [Candidatus Saccharimonadales bacterium]
METVDFSCGSAALPTNNSELRLYIDARRQKELSWLESFELGVALCEEIDLINDGVEPEIPAPSQDTEELRRAVASTLLNSNVEQRDELSLLLNDEFELIKRDTREPVETPTEPEPETDENSISYDAYSGLRELSGIGTLHAWTHGWNKARVLGLTNDNGELKVSALERALDKWSKFRPVGVGKLTLRVYQTVVDRNKAH